MKTVRTVQFENQHKTSTAGCLRSHRSAQKQGSQQVTMTALRGNGEGGILIRPFRNLRSLPVLWR